MNRKKRWLTAKFPIAAISAAAMVAGAPASALADHDDRGRRARAEHPAHHRYEPCDHHDHYDTRHGRRDAREERRRARYEARLYRKAVHEARAARYHCRRCNEGFHGRTELFRHVTHHHHVPPWVVPFLLVHNSLGWVFYG